MSFWKSLLASILGFFISWVLLMIACVVVIVGMVAAGMSGGEPKGSKKATKHGTILVSKLQRPLPEYIVSTFNPFGDDGQANRTLREYLQSLESARRDKNIGGVCLQLNGYSGSWPQAATLRQKFAELKNSGKFIYAVSDVNGMNEKEYYLATVADTVIFNPAANLELNGLSVEMMFFKPALDNLGIRAEAIKAGKYKSAVEPFIRSEASPENRSMTQGIIDTMFAGFKATVLQSRKISAAGLEAIINNTMILTAYQAQASGLVDVVAYQSAIDSLLMKRVGATDDKKPRMIDIDDYAISNQAIAGGGDNEDGESDNQIALVYAVGQITQGKSSFSSNPLTGGGQTLGSQTFCQTMKEVREDDDVKAVVLRVDSPGGEAGASQEMWYEVKLTALKKPVIVSMGTYAASGGYFIAAPATRIFAEPGTLTGSIGVFGLVFTAEKLFHDKLGINVESIQTNPNANMSSAMHAKTPLQLSVLQNRVDSVYGLFKSIVSQGRRIPEDKVEELAQGRVWLGSQARALGLVDEIGGLDSAISFAASKAGIKQYSLVVLPRRKSFWESFGDIFDQSTSALLQIRQQNILDYKAVEKIVRQRAGVQALGPVLEIE